jgi:hypothetical protein
VVESWEEEEEPERRSQLVRRRGVLRTRRRIKKWIGRDGGRRTDRTKIVGEVVKVMGEDGWMVDRVWGRRRE